MLETVPPCLALQEEIARHWRPEDEGHQGFVGVVFPPMWHKQREQCDRQEYEHKWHDQQE